MQPENIFLNVAETFASIQGESTHAGRLCFFIRLAGCNLACSYCDTCYAQAENSGQDRSIAELVAEVKASKINLVELTGGEPALQQEFTLELLKACKKENLHTALDTSGCIPIENMQPLLDAADLILLDVKASNRELTTKISGNPLLYDRVLATLEYCEKTNKPVWIRHVLIEEFTLVKDNLIELAQLLKPYKCIEKVEFLGFHTMGFFKWEELKMENPLLNSPAISDDKVKTAEKIFLDFFKQ